MKRFATLAAFLAASTVNAGTIEVDTYEVSGSKDGKCTFDLNIY